MTKITLTKLNRLFTKNEDDDVVRRDKPLPPRDKRPDFCLVCGSRMNDSAVGQVAKYHKDCRKLRNKKR